MLRAPHAARCLARLDRIDAPVVQVWGWPGSGATAVVEALLDREEARALAPADLLAWAGGAGGRAAEPAIRDGVRALCAQGARWLVVPGLPDGARSWLPALARAVPAGRRLVFAGHRRLAPPGAGTGLLMPGDLLLTVEEGVALARQVLGDSRKPEAIRRLVKAAEGWYRPLLLAVEHAVASGNGRSRLPWDPEALAALPPVAEFLRVQVLAGLDEGEREALVQAAAGYPPDGGAVRRLVEERGLLRETAEGLRAPRLLAAFLARRASGPEGGAGPAPAPVLPVPPGRGTGGSAGGPAEGQEASEGPASGTLLPAAEPGPTPEPAPSPPEAARYRIHLLGRPEVWRRVRPEGPEAVEGAEGAGGPAAPGGGGAKGWERLHWPLKRALLALAYLASSPERRASREELVEALWPEHDDEAVRRNFHPTLSHLRRGLRGGAGAAAGATAGATGEPLAFQDGVYGLTPEPGWWIDLEELERLAAVGRSRVEEGRDAAAVAAWKEAWRLYRGEFLDGVDEPWATRRREVHRRVYLGVLAGLGAASERLGRAEEAVDAYRALLVEDPLQEKIHLALMHLYGHQGRRDLVRRQYERLTALLRDELGVEPSPETTRDYHRLMIHR